MPEFHRGLAKTNGFCLCVDTVWISYSGLFVHFPNYVIRKHHFPPHLLTFNRVIYTFWIT